MALSDSKPPTILLDMQELLRRLDEAMARVPIDVQQIKTDLQQLVSEVTIMRAVITDHSYELKAYGERFRDLERNY